MPNKEKTSKLAQKLAARSAQLSPEKQKSIEAMRVEKATEVAADIERGRLVSEAAHAKLKEEEKARNDAHSKWLLKEEYVDTIEITKHAEERMEERKITLTDMACGEVTVITGTKNNKTAIVTVYE
jgi:hypothetical protein